MELTLEELAKEIKKEEPLEFVTIKIQDKMYTLQLLKGTKAKYGLDGQTWLHFITDKPYADEPCITVVFSENEVHLGSYYFKAPSTCYRLPHDIFFNHFLSPLAKLFGASEINLNDASTKQFRNCTVPMIFFALAGKRTFYNAFGFENTIFDESVKLLRRSSLAEMSKIQSPGIVFNKMFNDFELTRKIQQSGYFYKSVSSVAQFVVNTCRDESTPEDIELANNFIRYFRATFFVENNFVKKIGGSKRRKTRRK